MLSNHCLEATQFITADPQMPIAATESVAPSITTTQSATAAPQSVSTIAATLSNYYNFKYIKGNDSEQFNSSCNFS